MLSRRRSDPKWYTGDVHTASVAEPNQAEVRARVQNEKFDVHLQVLTKNMLSNVNKLANN